MKQYELFINGEFIPNGDREMITVINPATEEPISQVPRATEADVAAAVDAAYEAQKSWAKLPPIERAAYLNELAQLVRENVELLAKTNSEEMGKPYAQSFGCASWLADFIDYYAGFARHIKGEIVPSDRPNENILLYKRPIGVAAGILPWNFPLYLIGRKVAPALIAGCTVVLKPSSDSPNGCYEFAKLVAKSSLPKGVINVVSGAGGVVGEGLASNPKVGLVSMTGSTEAGVKIMKAAANNITKVSLELGGKAPVIVCRDCDLDATVQNVYQSRIFNTGESCNSAERIFVHEDILEEFTAKIVEKFKATTYGDPLKGEYDLGALVNKGHQEHVDELVQSAVAEGATILCGGHKATVDGKGFFYEPTVIGNCRHGMRIMTEEIFAPVLPIASFNDLDDVLEKANDCEYGLTSSIHTQDYDTVMRALNELKYGETYVNREHIESFQGFHAGVRKSGIGGDDGDHGLDEFMVTQICYIDYKTDAKCK